MFCRNCGNQLINGNRYCRYCGVDQQPAAASASADNSTSQPLPIQQQTVGVPIKPPLYQQPQMSPPPRPLQKPPKSVMGIVAIITAVVVVAVCTASYFLFFDGKPAGQQTSALDIPVESAEAGGDPTQKPAEAPADEAAGSSTAAPAVTESQTPPTQAAETVSAQTITVSMAYDSGEGIYTGEVKDGVPHGPGSFEMLKSDSGISWSYDGQWENGEVTGEGTMTEGPFVFIGSFKSGLLNGSCEITDNGVLRYRGMCQDGKLHGQGTLYTKSGMLLFEGTFDNDMLVESAADRQARGESFIPECNGMDEILYGACMAEDNTFGYPVAVWGFSLAMGEQTANGTIVIGHMGDDSYPVCLVYRYGLNEPKMTGDDWINAWGVVGGTYEYVDADGLTVTCPMVEVVCWNNRQEG